MDPHDYAGALYSIFLVVAGEVYAHVVSVDERLKQIVFGAEEIFLVFAYFNGFQRF